MKINACYLAPPVRIGRFCLRKVLLSTWPGWWQLSYLNSGKDTRHLLNGVTYTISVPLCDRQLLPNKAYINSTHLPLKRTAPKMLSKCLYYILFSLLQSLFAVLILEIEKQSSDLPASYWYICKKLISLKQCVRSQITRLKMQKSFCDLEHGASLWI